MKKRLLAMLVFLSAENVSAATSGDVGFGVLAGHPMGPTMEMWVSPSQAVNVGIGFNDLSLYADYQWHNWTLIRQPMEGCGRIGTYAALGGKVERQDNDRALLGIRTLVGMTFRFSRERVELYAELGPVFELTPETGVDIDGGVGVRFTFGRNR